jgi:hypothetical protein
MSKKTETTAEAIPFDYVTPVNPFPVDHSEIWNCESVVPTKLEQLMETHKTKSAVIRYLSNEGWSRGAIAKFMDIRYQHVRNVLTNLPKNQ